MRATGMLIAESLARELVLDDIDVEVTKISRADFGDVAAGQPLTWTFETARRFTPAGFSLPSIKCNPDPARLSPDDVTLVIAVLRVDN